MQTKSPSQLYQISLVYKKDDGTETTKIVTVRASTREIAINRALKRNPSAIGVKENG